jgi:predicted glutamine amidotransferase|tara:strand:- start:15914 stop:17002 length:1089 start_codon:yes stop_codon:yes gene_type:complete
MCGLVGVFGAPSAKTTNMFLDMLRMDVVRGDDSTGIGVIGKKKRRVIKDVGDPYYVIGHKNFKKWVVDKAWENWGYLGHNRAATRGTVTPENAHPFYHAPIMLTHNGTLHNTLPIKIDLEHFDTDSEQIAYFLKHESEDDLWPLLEGAAALAWFDSSNHSLNLITNGKRPLCFSFLNDEEQIAYASEPWMIRGAAWRRSQKFEQVWACKEHVLYTFKREGRKVVQERKTLTPHVPRPFVLVTSTKTGGVSGDGKKGLRVWDSVAREWVDRVPLTPVKVEELIPFGTDITKEQEENKGFHWKNQQPSDLAQQEIDKIYQKCQLCGGKLTVGDVVPIDLYHAACGSCADTADFFEMDMSQMRGM